MTGWTWDYVEDTLTVQRLLALYAEWKRNPPLPLLVAAFMGIKPEEKGTADELLQQIMKSGLVEAKL